MDRQKILRLPNLSGMRSEVIPQKSHRFGYDHAVRNCGVRLVEVGTREDLERAINVARASADRKAAACYWAERT